MQGRFVESQLPTPKSCCLTDLGTLVRKHRLDGISYGSEEKLHSSWCDSTEVERRTGNSNGHAGEGSMPAYAFSSNMFGLIARSD